MNQRVNQFFRAITAKLGEEDHAFIGRYLSPDEAELFFGMHVADQYHALKVAYTAGDFASEGNLQVDQDLLIRGASENETPDCIAEPSQTHNIKVS